MILQQALKHITREWRSGELYVLFFSIVIAVAAVSSVSFFTDRVQRALASQANELLGADLVVNSDQELDQSYYALAKSLDLKAVRQLTFPSMILSEKNSHLAWIKVVEKGYPLRGELEISRELFAPEAKTSEIPASGEVWIEPRLLTALGAKMSDVLHVGAASLTASALVISEPGRGGDIFNVAPRVLMNFDDLAASQLIQVGSRVRYSLLLAGAENSISEFEQFVKNKNDFGVSAQGIRDARPEIRIALERAEQFLGLAALTSVVLAGVAIALAAKRFAVRHLDHCAILRCVGASQGYILKLYLWQILLLGLVASAVGAVAGFFAHQILFSMLGSLVGVELPSPGVAPIGFAITTGIITLLGFALPPIVALKQVPALRVLKRDLGNVDSSRVLRYSLGVVALGIIMVIQAGDVKLGIYMVAGVLATIAALTAVAYLLLWFVRRMKPVSYSAWYIGLRNLVRRPGSSVVQIIAFGLGIMALLVLTVIRGDLLDEWQASIPDDAPNRFVININPNQVQDMTKFFESNIEKVPEFFQMVRGRLIGINDRSITSDSFEDQRARQMLSREFNLGWSETLPANNKLLQGQWWQVEDFSNPQVSIEKSVAENLQINIGDILKFKVADQFFEAKVSSVREVDWSSFGANFYVLTTPGLLRDFPSTYMSPFFLSQEKYQLLNELVARFGNITVIDVAAIMNHVRQIINRVTLAVEYVFMFTLLAGLMVLFAGIQSTLDERLVENAIMKTVGGKKKQLLQALWAEYISLGAFAGLVAALLATVVSFVIAYYVLKMPIQWNATIWIYGLFGGALGVGIFGVLGSLAAIHQPPLQILKKVSLTN